MKILPAKSNWLRILGAALGVIAASFISSMIVIFVYALVLAIQARGAPNQTTINHFAAAISPKMLPWLELFWAFTLSFRIGRKTEAESSTQGLFIGILAGMLSLLIPLCFRGGLSLFSVFLLLGIIGCGYIGGIFGEKWPAKK